MQINDLKQIKKELKTLIYKNAGEDQSLHIMIYQDEYLLFNVQIDYRLNRESIENWYPYENIITFEEANKKAKQVLNTVKKWFNIEICNNIESYHI